MIDGRLVERSARSFQVPGCRPRVRGPSGHVSISEVRGRGPAVLEGLLEFDARTVEAASLLVQRGYCIWHRAPPGAGRRSIGPGRGVRWTRAVRMVIPPVMLELVYLVPRPTSATGSHSMRPRTRSRSVLRRAPTNRTRRALGARRSTDSAGASSR